MISPSSAQNHPNTIVKKQQRALRQQQKPKQQQEQHLAITTTTDNDLENPSISSAPSSFSGTANTTTNNPSLLRMMSSPTKRRKGRLLRQPKKSSHYNNKDDSKGLLAVLLVVAFFVVLEVMVVDHLFLGPKEIYNSLELKVLSSTTTTTNVYLSDIVEAGFNRYYRAGEFQKILLRQQSQSDSNKHDNNGERIVQGVMEGTSGIIADEGIIEVVSKEDPAMMQQQQQQKLDDESRNSIAMEAAMAAVDRSQDTEDGSD